jgi:hypothetical protein
MGWKMSDQLYEFGKLLLSAVFGGGLTALISAIANRNKTNAEASSIEVDTANRAIKVWEETNKHLREEVYQARKEETSARKDSSEALRQLKISQTQSQEYKHQYDAQVSENRRQFAEMQEFRLELEKVKSQMTVYVETQRKVSIEKDKLLADFEAKLRDCQSKLTTAQLVTAHAEQH